MLRKRLDTGEPAADRVLQLTVRLYHRPTVRLLEAHWRETQPDMVVSFVPHFNRALGESFRLAFPGRPFVTILTDIADYPPHFWIERQPQYLICGSDRAVEQARAMGHSDDRIFRASGMILASAVLRRAGRRPRRGPRAPWTAARSSDGPGSVRRARLERDAGNRRAPGPVESGSAADLRLRRKREAGECAARAEIAHAVFCRRIYDASE